MTDQTMSDSEAEIIAQRVAKHSDLVDAARKSSISPRECIIRILAFFALAAYLEFNNIDLGGALFGLTVYFLILYSRDNRRREKRIDALVELLGLKEGRTINITGDAEQ
jgi:hypothetical protein